MHVKSKKERVEIGQRAAHSSSRVSSPSDRGKVWLLMWAGSETVILSSHNCLPASSRCRRLQVLLSLGLRKVSPVILALDLLHKLLHLLDLAVPLVLGHLGLTAEQLLVGLAVATAQSIPERGELAVVEVEVQMVHRVAGRAVDHGAVRYVLAIVDEDCPDVDRDEEQHVRELLQREDEWEDVVWETLGPAVDGMEGMRGVRRRHDPLVVRLVQAFVDQGMMQATVDPVDEEIGEHEEERELENVVKREGRIVQRVVHLSVAHDFHEEEGRSEGGQSGHRLHGLLNLHAHLVLEVLRVVEGGFVEDIVVGESGEAEVDEEAEDPIEEENQRRISKEGFTSWHTM